MGGWLLPGFWRHMYEQERKTASLQTDQIIKIKMFNPAELQPRNNNKDMLPSACICAQTNAQVLKTGW